MTRNSPKRRTERTSGRSQVVCLPKESRFDSDAVLVHREGNAGILEVHEWPDGYVESFASVADDFDRPAQGSA